MRTKRDIIRSRDAYNKKMNDSAVIIQKYIRGYLTRKTLDHRLIEFGKIRLHQNLNVLESVISHVCFDLGKSVNNLVTLIQKHVRGKIARRHYKIIRDISRYNSLEKEKAAIINIIKWIKMIEAKRIVVKTKIFDKKIKGIREKLAFLSVKKL